MNESQMSGISEHNPVIKELRKANKKHNDCKLSDCLITAGIVIALWTAALYPLLGNK